MARENVYPDTSAADRGVSTVLESRDACMTEAYKGVLQECIVLWQICRAIPARDTRSFFNLLCDRCNLDSKTVLDIDECVSALSDLLGG